MKVLFMLLGGIAGLAAVVALLTVIIFSAYMFWQVAWNTVSRPAQLPIVIRIAFRNLFASKLKTIIIGSIIGGGAVLIVVGTSFIGSMSDGMSRSVIGAAAGDAQLYQPKYGDGGGDELAIWGGGMSEPELGVIPDFDKLQGAIAKVDNVKAVVPMGIAGAMVTSGNTIDLALGDLREAENKKKAGDATVQGRIDAQKAHIRHIIDVLKGDQKNRAEVSSETRGTTQEEVDAVNTASDSKFWDSFESDPFGKLEFLENKIAPQAADADLLYLRYIGTNLEQFSKSFDRMEIVDGTAVPAGQRGFLMAKNFYENMVKLKSAHRLDTIKDAIEIKKQNISEQEDLQRLVKENTTQTREIALQLDDLKAKEMIARLQKATGSQETQLEKLLAVSSTPTTPTSCTLRRLLQRHGAAARAVPHPRGRHAHDQAYTKSGYPNSVTSASTERSSSTAWTRVRSRRSSLMDLSSYPRYPTASLPPPTSPSRKPSRRSRA